MTILFSLLLLITTVTGGSTPDCIIPKVSSYTTATGKSAGSITLDKEKDFALSDADLAAIKFKIGPKEQKGKPEGAYTLTINRKGITVNAAGEAGKFYALQSLIQMRNADPEGRVAFCRIDDYPRFPYRGLMFDLVRHFQSKEFILKQLDAMALVKMSRLHLHLTDNEAWRIELDCAPEMTAKAAFGDSWFFHNFLSGKTQKFADTPAGYTPGTVYDDAHIYGGYLTKDDIREIIAYAAERQIEIIPEIELPGHNKALLHVHPEFFCNGEHKANNVFCAGLEEPFAFFENVLAEVMELFPSQYIHIGGDEASKANWVICGRCKQRMAAEGLKDEFELQSYIIRRVEKFVNAHGKRLIGWDEILEGGLSDNATVMSWRGTAGGIKANSMGHDVIMTPNTYYYLDYGQDAPYKEPMSFRPYLAIENVYGYDPEEGISSLEHLLGVQANLWGECVLEPWHFEYMLYPRAFALAETGWSPAGSKDYASFRERAIALGKWLKARDYTLFDLETEVGDRPEAAVEIPRITKKATATISINNGAPQDASILVDGRLGGWNVADRKVWSEVRGKTVTIDIDLGEKYNISYLGAEFADYNLRHIRMPEDVQFSVSSDGKKYTPVSVPQPKLHPERKHFQILTVGGTVEVNGIKYVRLSYNTGKKKVTVDISEVIINGRPRSENREKDWAKFSRYSEDNKIVKDKPVAVLFGDSITQNWAKFDYQWLRDHGFIGRGISGQTTSEMLVRFRADVIELAPEYVTILAGINDIAHNNGIIKVENTFKNLVSMVELAKLHGIKPVLCTLVPAKEIGWYKQVGDPRPAIDSLNTMIRSYAEANGILLADYHTALKTDDGALRAEYAGDAVHPNVAGTKVMEEVLLQTLGQASETRQADKPILTPPAPKTPRVNGAKVYGARPGASFLYRIPATGERPMRFSAEGLPKGLTLDARTGIISGKVSNPGTWKVTLRAENALGSSERTLKIVIGDKISLTPPLGWNSWNVWGNSVSQEKVLSSARAMVESGLADCGWQYINIDDGWQGIRGGAYKAIQPNSKFPDMKALADEIHALGLKFGIYSGPWTTTYAGHIGETCDNADGTYDFITKGLCDEVYKTDRSKVDRKTLRYFGKCSFVEADVRQWAEWGVDYLKYDWYPNDEAHAREMAEVLRASGRDIVYSLSNRAPFALAPVWMDCANAWRTTDDIRDTWASVKTIGFGGQDRWAPFHGPGHWPDADMLVVGKVGWGPSVHDSRLTADEQYTHISLWALLASPLLIGCDMADMDAFTIGLLSNTEVLDVNQDPLGLQASLVDSGDGRAVYMKPLEDGTLAVGLFNLRDVPARIGFSARALGVHTAFAVRDLWRQKDLGTVAAGGSWDAEVAPHGVVLIKLTNN